MEKKRLSQLISLLVASTTAHAYATSPELIISAPTSNVQIADAKELVHITQAGSVTGAPGSALAVNSGVSVTTLTNDGYITDVINTPLFLSSHVVQIDGTVGELNNNGTIASLNQYQNGRVVAVGESGVINTFTNSGTIKGVQNVYNYYDSNSNNNGTIDNAGTITTLLNTTEGKIFGTRAISNQGTIDNLTNAGLIAFTPSENNIYSGQNSAIFNNGTIGTLHNTGTIDGGTSDDYDRSGIYNKGTINTLINDNKINGSFTGIYSNGGISEIVNNGEISGKSNGMYLWNYYNQSAAVHIVNNGQLTGSDFALLVGSNNSDGATLTNTGNIAGNIFALNGTPLIINGGTTTTGTLAGIDGATGTLIGSDIIFGSGSLLLNDNIVTSMPEYGLMSLQMSDESPASNGTVVNEAASLQVNNSINIAGDYHQKAAATLISGVSDLTDARGDLLADTGYGRLNVSGNAIVDAGSSIKLLRTGSTYQFAEGQRYVVINATGAETDYHADQLNYKALGYRGTVNGSVYDATDSKALVLTLGAEPVVIAPVEPQPEPTPEVTPPVVTEPDVTTPIVTVPTPPTPPAEPTPTQPTKRGYATIPSATAALGGLARYSGIASPQLLDLYNASLAIEGKQEANRAGERLSTSQNLNTSSAATVATSTAQAVVGAHIDAVRNP